jgi:transposase
VRPRRGCNLQGRGLSFAEREEIALGRARGKTIGGIARRLERLPSTVWRELTRNADRCDAGYRATAAHASYQRRKPSQAGPAGHQPAAARLASLDREAVGIVGELDERLISIEQELRPLARADPRVALLVTIPGIGDLLGLTIASEIGDISRFLTARKLVGYSGLTPRVYQSGQKSRTVKLAKTGSTMLRWSAIEAAQQAWRATNPWHQLYRDVKKTLRRQGQPVPAPVQRTLLW